MSFISFQYVHLNALFYEDFKGYHEIMMNEDRQYLHIITDYRGNTYAIPFRSEITHAFCFRLSSVDNKGLDYTKSVIINDVLKYVYLSKKNIPQNQHNLIVANEVKIKRYFYRYVDDYCKAVQKNDVNVLRRIGRFSSLKNYHKELNLPL